MRIAYFVFGGVFFTLGILTMALSIIHNRDGFALAGVICGTSFFALQCGNLQGKLDQAKST